MLTPKKRFPNMFKSNMFIHGYLGQKCSLKKDFQTCLKVTCLVMVTWDRNAHSKKDFQTCLKINKNNSG